MRTLMALYPPASLALFGAVGGAFFLPLALIAIFGLVDTVGRYRDYKYLSRFNYLTPRLADFYGRSRCGRSVIIALGGGSYRDYYKERGFRWWHVLPEGFPKVLLNKRFWRALAKGHTA